MTKAIPLILLAALAIYAFAQLAIATAQTVERIAATVEATTTLKEQN